MRPSYPFSSVSSLKRVIRRSLTARTSISNNNSFSSLGEEDRALQWARAHPHIAQQCLDPPPLIDSADHLEHENYNNHSHTHKHCRDFDDYWKHRKWRFPTSSLITKDTRPLAQSLTTHVLSAPLTIAQQFATFLSTNQQQQQRWCCVGARAEASLPTLYWRELLIVLDWIQHHHTTTTSTNHNSTTGNNNIIISLDFVGPELPTTNRPSETLTYKDSAITLNWNKASKFHELDPNFALSYNGYILFNPGLAHPHLASDWRPTVELILHTKQPLLLTAHSLLDANRDAKLLSQYLPTPATTPTPTPIHYVPNPFASRITYQDPFDNSHMVQPNHYVASLFT